MTRCFLNSKCCLSALALSALLAGGAFAEDELFSRIPIDTVFSKTPETPATPSRPSASEKSIRVLNIEQLGDLLKEAGLNPEVAETTASIKVEQGKRTFTTILGLDESRDQIVVIMRLAEMEGKSLPAEKLLMMMTVNRDLRPAMFSYSEKNKRLELIAGLENDQISGRKLKDEVKRLAGIADNMSPLWELDAAQAPAAAAPSQNAIANNPAPAQTNTTAPAQQRPAAGAPAATAPAATAANSTILGRWSAARSAKEAFAMQLNADSSFVLVYVKDGKQSKSTGKYTLTGSQLSLATDDGGKFGGSVSNITAKSFEFTPPTGNSGKLTFQKAS